MEQFTYTIKDPAGIHARPAGNLVKLVRESGSEVSIEKNGQTANLKKLFTVMALGVKQGDTVTIRVSGDDEKTLLEKLKAFLEENL